MQRPNELTIVLTAVVRPGSSDQAGAGLAGATGVEQFLPRPEQIRCQLRIADENVGTHARRDKQWVVAKGHRIAQGQVVVGIAGAGAGAGGRGRGGRYAAQKAEPGEDDPRRHGSRTSAESMHDPSSQPGRGQEQALVSRPATRTRQLNADWMITTGLCLTIDVPSISRQSCDSQVVPESACGRDLVEVASCHGAGAPDLGPRRRAAAETPISEACDIAQRLPGLRHSGVMSVSVMAG